MKSLFEPAKVGGLSLRNRLIRSATFEGVFDEQEHFADKLLPMYEQLAQGGIGAIISGMVGVDQNSRATPTMVKAYGKTFIPEMKRLAGRLRESDVKLVVQLSHCGLKAGQIDGGGRPFGPSGLDAPADKVIKEMKRDDIQAVAAAFAGAAAACREAGADAVQLHGAHGYLLSQFLSPHYNKRTDEYGGGIENRARIVLEVYEAVRAAVGSDYPLWIKLNSRDLTEETISPEEFLWLGRELDRRKIQAIEVSGGLAASAKSSSAQVVKTEAEEGCFVREALELAETVSASVINVCGFRTPEVIEKWLNAGRLEAISLCRPLISEPGLIKRWADGDRRKSRCLSCNKCFSATEPLACRAFPQAG